MAVIEFPDQVSRILSRPDFRGLSGGISVRVVPDLPRSFLVSKVGDILLHPACAADALLGPVAIRHALELLLLRRLWPTLPALAGLAAARTAALFAILEASGTPVVAPGDGAIAPDDPALASGIPAGAGQLQALWRTLADHQSGADPGLPAGSGGMLARIWSVLGPTEWLMQGGGDPHLRTDPASGLNGYGCSFRPTPSLVSCGSATASSISERGYGAAEAMRQTLLAEIVDNASAVGNALASVRGVIRTAWGLPPGTFIALAQSSAEAELFALAAAQGHPDGRPVTAVLMAPGEIDGGVAIAAAGRHPAAITARGVRVEHTALIDGYGGDTQVRTVELRDGDGGVRDAADVAAECARIAQAGVTDGRRVVLHHLNVSRTGLAGPETSSLSGMQERYPGRVDVVVDASQARLCPDRIWDYLALGWIVLLTGSKCLTGPPSSAAVLVPETLRDRFARKLPEGLRDYSNRAEWPPSLAAAAQLPPGGEIGLALRWSAALAEWLSFNTVAPAEQRRIVSEFSFSVRSAVAGNADLRLLDAPAPPRATARILMDELAWNGADRGGPGWDESATVVSFAMRDPDGPGWLSAAAARNVHYWLQSDLGASLPERAATTEQQLARRGFQVGQPVTVLMAGHDVGVLSIAASTRLVSAEPSRAASSLDERLARAILDAHAVLEKVSIILRHWPALYRRAPDGAAV